MAFSLTRKLSEEQIVADNDSQYDYEEVPIDEDFLKDDIEEDLDKAVRTLTEATQDALAAVRLILLFFIWHLFQHTA